MSGDANTQMVWNRLLADTQARAKAEANRIVEEAGAAAARTFPGGDRRQLQFAMGWLSAKITGIPLSGGKAVGRR